jgi:hypothetical protein
MNFLNIAAAAVQTTVGAQFLRIPGEPDLDFQKMKRGFENLAATSDNASYREDAKKYLEALFT